MSVLDIARFFVLKSKFLLADGVTALIAATVHLAGVVAVAAGEQAFALGAAQAALATLDGAFEITDWMHKFTFIVHHNLIYFIFC